MDYNSKKFYCFTPQVMVVTFLLETIFAIYTYLRYGKNNFGKIACVTLLLLATFQLAESRICAGSNTLAWSHIGFAAITLLPLAGLYLISLVSHKTHFLRLGYILTGIFLFYFLFVPKTITGSLCTGNYIIFNTAQGLYLLFGLYYFVFLLLAIWESCKKIIERGTRSAIRSILHWFIIAYLSFILPMAFVYVIIPTTQLPLHQLCAVLQLCLLVS